jgi:sarcosine oxidase delta subunit
LQHLFDVVDEQHRNGSKRWLTALRDSIAFKIGYAYVFRARWAFPTSSVVTS